MSTDGRAPGKPLPAEAVVFRGLRSSSWVHRDSGSIMAVAFLRLQDEDAPSVSESASNAVQCLRRHFGVAKLVVERVRGARAFDGDSLGLDVISDPIWDREPPDPWHALITGLPTWSPAGTEQAQAQLDAAFALLESATPEWIR